MAPKLAGRVSMAVIFAAFVDNMGQQPLISPYAVVLGATARGAALIVGAFSAANLVGNILSAGAMAWMGHRRTIILGLAGSGAALLAYTLVRDPSAMASVRVAHGLAAGLLVPAVFSYLGDRAPETRRGAVMGRAGVAVGLAAVIGPAIAGTLRQTGGFSLPFSVMGLILLAGAGLASALPAGHRPVLLGSGRTVTAMARVASSPQLQAALAAALALMLSMGMLGYRLPLLAEELGHPAYSTGLLFSAFAATAMVLMAKVTGRLSDAAGRHLPIGLGLGAVAVGLVGLELSTTLTAWSALIVLYGAGFGLVFPAMNALVLDGRTGESGPAFALFHAFFSLGVILGPILGAARLPLPPFGRAALVACAVAIYMGRMSMRSKLERQG